MRKLKAFSYRELHSDEATVNLTPLIDVVFVVLIIFIIIAPMLELDRIQLAGASDKETREAKVFKDSSPIAIHVRADNSIWFNSACVTVNELPRLLKEAKKMHPQYIPQLFHDRKAFFETYQMVKNAVENAGFEQMDVILQPGG
jgi:biopolymer transport protein ExbD